MTNAPSPYRILLVDDDEDSRALMSRALRNNNLQVTEAADGAEALALDLRSFDVVLTDLQMPSVNGHEVLERVRAQSPLTPVIVFTAYADADSALDLMSKGAYDYLPRPVDLTRLRHVVHRALDWHRLATENNSLKQPQPLHSDTDSHREPKLIGTSPAMLEVYKVIAQVAPTIATVLITGDSGTGKELIARAIHKRSRRPGPFVSVHCSALPEANLMAELFGSDAPDTDNRPCALARAHGGTLFLDDVNDAPASVQSRLLQALEERTVYQHGQAHHVDVRFIASAHDDLQTSVSEGHFCEDLLFRLQVVTVAVPPLTVRREDLPLLFEHFIDHFATMLGRPAPVLSPDARDALLAHDWPGNVRELAQTLERAVVLARGAIITRDELPSGLHHPDIATDITAASDWPSLATIERRYIDRVLQHTGGNKTRAALVLGIDRRTLSRLFARERAAARKLPPQSPHAVARESN